MSDVPICHTCEQPITLLNSQKNGTLDQCLPCALNAAPLVLYRLKRRSEVIVCEVICQSHYQEQLQPGRGMEPLSEREQGAGYTASAKPYTGQGTCATCDAEAMHAAERDKKGAA